MHRDLDLAVDVTEASVDPALVVLYGIGYEIETNWRPTRVELAAQGERWVDQAEVDQLIARDRDDQIRGADVD